MLENTVKVLSLLEGNKFNSNDLFVFSVCTDLLFTSNKGFWTKGSKDRETLLALLGNKLQLNITTTDQENLIKFSQGLLILALSLINGLGRSPLTVQKEQKHLLVSFPGKVLKIKLTLGQYDQEMLKLVQEFKKTFFGTNGDGTIGRADFLVIKEALKETIARLDREKRFIQKMAENPLLLFSEKLTENSFSSALFLLLSALPAETLNRMLIEIGSYLPPELEEHTEDNLQVNVRHYLTTSTINIHELFKKVRLLLKLYFSNQRQIISIIVKEKVKTLFENILTTETTKKELQNHLQQTATNQFEIRLKILEALVKLL